MFSLTDQPISPRDLRGAVAGDGTGAVVLFEGVVRNINDGRTVVRLDYEGVPELAVHAFRDIANEAGEQFGITGAAGIHRTGNLVPGDIAVCIAVGASHRGAAFDACRYIIDQTKHRLPVWKKEWYEDGTSAWIHHP